MEDLRAHITLLAAGAGLLLSACAHQAGDAKVRFPGFHDGDGVTPAIVERVVAPADEEPLASGGGPETVRYDPYADNRDNLATHLYGPYRHLSWRDRYWYEYQRRLNRSLYAHRFNPYYYDPFFNPYDPFYYGWNGWAYDPWLYGPSYGLYGYYDPYWYGYGGYGGYGGSSGYSWGSYYGYPYYVSGVVRSGGTSSQRRRSSRDGNGRLMDLLFGQGSRAANQSATAVASRESSNRTQARSANRSRSRSTTRATRSSSRSSSSKSSSSTRRSSRRKD